MRWEMKVTNVTTRLRVRTGPSTSYRISSYKYPGDGGIVVDSKSVGGATWYKWEGTELWSCGKESNGTVYLTFVRDLEPPAEDTTPPAPTTPTQTPSNNDNEIGTTERKPFYTYNDSTLENRTTFNVSYNADDDWYIDTNIDYGNHPNLTDEQIRDEISRIKYNMDISYANRDDLYEQGKGSIGYLTDLQAKMHHSFNRNKTAFPDKELSKTFAYVFFTRPDLNILTTGASAGSFALTSDVRTDPKYGYIFKNNSNTLRSLVDNGNPYHKFLILLSNEAMSFEISDNVIKTIEHGETYNGNKIVYGRTDHESNAAGECNIRYIDTVNLDIFKMHLIWVDYINKVSRGEFSPKSEYIKQRILDYACSCYYFLCGPDGSTILYWQKLTGMFPVNTGENAFSWDSGTLLAKPEINIRYMYSMRTSMDVFHLSEFNALTNVNKANTSGSSFFKTSYSPKNVQTGSTLTHSPYVWQTKDVKGNVIFRLMWCDNK